jgi:hypothetical protein
MEEQVTALSIDKSKTLVSDQLLDRPLRHNCHSLKKVENTTHPGCRLHPEPLNVEEDCGLIVARENQPQLGDQQLRILETLPLRESQGDQNESTLIESGLTSLLTANTRIIAQSSPKGNGGYRSNLWNPPRFEQMGYLRDTHLRRQDCLRAKPSVMLKP